MRKLAVVALIFLSFSIFGQAQSKTHSSSDKWEVFAGYTLSRQYGMLNPYSLNSSGNGDEFAPFNQNGGQAAVSYFPTRHFGVTYQMSFLVTGNRTFAGSTESVAINTQRYMIGPAFRYTLHGGAGRTTLFAHQLFGASHDTLSVSGAPTTYSFNDATMASGGGVDFKVTRHLSVRPAQCDYWAKQMNPSLLGGIFTGQSAKLGVTGFDYSAGAVLNF